VPFAFHEKPKYLFLGDDCGEKIFAKNEEEEGVGVLIQVIYYVLNVSLPFLRSVTKSQDSCMQRHLYNGPMQFVKIGPKFLMHSLWTIYVNFDIFLLPS
jgi:hypothetical protein